MVNLGCPYNFTFPNISKTLLLVPKDKGEIIQHSKSKYRLSKQNKVSKNFSKLCIYL